MKEDSIKTESVNGAVILTGTVAAPSHKSLAQDTVEGLPGVVSVDNQLKIKGDQPAEHSDTWINTKVRSTLLFHRNVSAAGTSVYVKDGVVTLTGPAPSPEAALQATKIAKDIKGVVSVNNQLVVKAG